MGSQPWFVGVVIQGSYYIPQLTLIHWSGQPGSYCIPQLTLVCWGDQPGLLLYTPADPGLLGWSARTPILYPSRIWFVGVVSQCSYCIPQPTLAHWSGQSGFLLYTQADSGSFGWSTRVPIVYPH